MSELLSKALEAEVLAQDLIRFAANLRGQAAFDTEATNYAADNAEPQGSDLTMRILKLARHMYRVRRIRERYLPAVLLGEPAWDILLDLYIAGLEDRHISVSSATRASCVPPTTALRWIGLMEQQGLVERHRAINDRRVQYLRLTPTAASNMEGYLRQAEIGMPGGSPIPLFLVK